MAQIINKNKKDDLTALEEYLDLTLIQIFTLVLISSFPEGIIRYAILQSINTLFSSKRKISASSFYNSLSKLEKKKLIEFVKDETGKITLVKITPKSTKALHQIGHIAILTGIGINEIINDLTKKVINQLDLKFPVDSAIVISQDLTLDLHLYPIIGKYIKHIHTLADDESFNRYIKPYSQEIHHTIVYNGMIREPNNIFDVAFLPSFQRFSTFHDMSEDRFISEVIRVTKPKGSVIFLAFNKPEKIKNFLIDGFIDLYLSNPLVFFISKSELEEIMIKASLEDITVVDFNGLILGLGIKPS
ncbi:MAG: hypothetical protein ACFE95_03975 [Candidatus Hodarchaeota archaeon]